MIFSIVIFAAIVVLYLVAIKRIWQGTSELDDSNPVPWWPFSDALWRGTARAAPVLGACAILVIGGGIASDLAHKDSAGYNVAMSVGVVGLLGIFLAGLPITFYNRPRFLVPPHQRDDPGTVAEWRRARRGGR